DPDRLGDAIETEDEGGIIFAELRAQARSKQEILAWGVLGDAIYYAAYHAYRAANRDPRGSISEVDEELLDDLDKHLRTLEPSSMALMARAAAYLRRHSDASLAPLKAYLLGGARTGGI